MRCLQLIDTIGREQLADELLRYNMIFFSDESHGRQEFYDGAIKLLQDLKSKDPAFSGVFGMEAFSPEKNPVLESLYKREEVSVESLKEEMQDITFEKRIFPLLEQIIASGLKPVGIGNDRFKHSSSFVPKANQFLWEEIKKYFPLEGKFMATVGSLHLEDPPYRNYSVPFLLKEEDKSLRIVIIKPEECLKGESFDLVMTSHCDRYSLSR